MAGEDSAKVKLLPVVTDVPTVRHCDDHVVSSQHCFRNGNVGSLKIMKDLRKKFTTVYATQAWGAHGRGSGRGSTEENAENTRKALMHVFDKYGMHSLLDAACGALEWTEPFIREMRATDSTFTYCGIDVVEEVVEANKARLPIDYCSFDAMDLSREIPPSGYDLILCRDALQHLPYENIAGMLDGFSKSGARYLLVTSFKNRILDFIQPPNRNIEIGDFFKNKLLRAPFRFNDGLIESLEDYRPTGNVTGHMLLVYDLSILSESSSFKSFIREYSMPADTR